MDAIAGDDEEMSIIDRPAAVGIAEAPDASEMLERHARHARGIYDRLGPLSSVLLAGRAGDEELMDLRREADEQRLHAATLLAQALQGTGEVRPEPDEERASDAIWALNSPELHSLLVTDRGWSGDDYEATVNDCLTALLLGGERGASPH